MRLLIAALLACLVCMTNADAAPLDGLHYFVGTWTCEKSATLDVARYGSRWIRMEYRRRNVLDRIGYVGYVPQLHEYVDREFFADGAYVEARASAPNARGMWIWKATGYAAGRGPVLHGTLGYIERGPSRFEERYALWYVVPVKGYMMEYGGSTCMKR